jgi:hypothetical protein
MDAGIANAREGGMGRECSAHGREGALFWRKKMMVEETVHEGASSLKSDVILRS